MKRNNDTDTPDFFDDPLQKLRHEWKHTIEGEGGDCPVCDKFGKVYRIKLNQSLALSIKWISDHGGESGWVDVQKQGPRWMLRSKTYALLSHWGMIEPLAPRSGVWRVTPTGKAFLAGNIKAPVAVYIYDNSVWAVDNENTTYRGCFGVKFDFNELMSASFNWANVKSSSSRKSDRK
jgi:hypothetical protein